MGTLFIFILLKRIEILQNTRLTKYKLINIYLGKLQTHTRREREARPIKNDRQTYTEQKGLAAVAETTDKTGRRKAILKEANKIIACLRKPNLNISPLTSYETCKTVVP